MSDDRRYDYSWIRPVVLEVLAVLAGLVLIGTVLAVAIIEIRDV